MYGGCCTGMLLDKYYLEDVYGNIHVVIGNRHPSGGIISFIKYVPFNGESIWCRSGVCYRRVVKHYFPDEVHGSCISRIYDPWSDSLVPFTPRSIVVRIYSPIDRAYTMISRPRDVVEEEAVELIGWIRRVSNIPWSCIGVTGSILPAIHNPLISDIDLVVYGGVCGWKVIEALSEGNNIARGFDRQRLVAWGLRLSRRYGIPFKKVIELYRLWRRGVLYTGREYSIAYASNRPRRFNGDRWVTIGYGVIKAYITPSKYSIEYPIQANIEEYSVIELKTSINTRISIAISYETLFMPALIEEGWRIINGLIQYNPYIETARIVIGTREKQGYIVKT